MGRDSFKVQMKYKIAMYLLQLLACDCQQEQNHLSTVYNFQLTIKRPYLRIGYAGLINSIACNAAN